MDAKSVLPADWDAFLDQVGRNLGEFLKRVPEAVGDGNVSPPPTFPFPLAERMQTIHEGMDERIGQLEIHLRALDESLARAEGEAHQLQGQAHQLRDRRSDSESHLESANAQ